MARTALKIVQDAAPRLGISIPEQLFASTDRMAKELSVTLNKCAVRLARLHDWEALLSVYTHTGNGSTTAFTKPSHYWRMPKEAQIWSSRWQRPLTHISAEDWLRLDVREYDLVTGNWTLFGNKFQYKPALADGETARFFFVSDNICTDNDGETLKMSFMADDDLFRLDDYMLELEFIWVWRKQKGMEYAEDMADAQEAVEKAITKDKGARIITQSSRKNVRAKTAYPWSIEP